MRRIVLREFGRTRPPEVLGMEGMVARESSPLQKGPVAKNLGQARRFAAEAR